MSEYRGLDLLDYLVIVVKHKILIITMGIFVLISSYLVIRFFIPEQFDSEALIVSSDSDSMGGLSSILSSFSDLPIGIPGLSGGGSTDRFTTIIYSRTNLDKIIAKFNLFEEYGLETMKETRKNLVSSIEAEETAEGAYRIGVRASSPQKSADMANFIVSELNTTMLELNTAKSKENRHFLERRYLEVKQNLRNAEDSLVVYQKESGIFLAEEQAFASFEAYSKLEAELATKEVEATVLGKLLGSDSPLVANAKIAADEFKRKLDRIKSGKDKAGIILSMNDLPKRTMNYLRFYRDVEIYNKMLAFIIPLYEQARFEEQKDIPLLQVIDEAVPPQKKSWPPRSLFALFFTIIIMMFVIAILIIRESLQNTTNPKVKFIMQNVYKKKSP